jgi:hypothetical protein
VTSTSEYILITSVAGLCLLIPAALGLGLFFSNDLTAFSPYPALTLIPYLILSQGHNWGNAAVKLPMLLFFLWNCQLFRGVAKVPKRSYVFLALLTVLSVIDFVVSWKSGVQHVGVKFTAAVFAVNIVWLAFLGLAFARTRSGKTSFGTSVFLQWMLFAWLSWYAFPWLYESLSQY